MKRDHDYLKRLPEEHYLGQAYIHWSMSIDGRKTGWLDPNFYAQFREVLIHTTFRYGLACPIYCCMPDHLHLLWIGIADDADQRRAVKYFRKHLNALLEGFEARLQKQPHDHVLREEERAKDAFETVVDYIARNPERAGLVLADFPQEYPYTGCVVPGYPELRFWQDDYWDRFWRTHEYLRARGLVVQSEPGNAP